MNSIVKAAEIKDIKPTCRVMWRSFHYLYQVVPDDFFEPFQDNDPYFKPDQMRVLWIDDEIAGGLRVFEKELFDGNKYLKLGGIGSVAIHPDYRGQGLFNILMDDTIQYMKNNNYDISTLYSGHTGLYEKYGYSKIIDRGFMKGVIKGNIKELQTTKDISKAKDLYDASIAKLPGSIRRTDTYWNMWIKDFKLKDLDVVYSDANDAYLIFGIDKNTGELNIADAGFDGDRDNLAQLINDKLCGRTLCGPMIDDKHPLQIVLRELDSNLVFDPYSGIFAQNLKGTDIPNMLETRVDGF